jgi:hypothetical protein
MCTERSAPRRPAPQGGQFPPRPGACAVSRSFRTEESIVRSISPSIGWDGWSTKLTLVERGRRTDRLNRFAITRFD